jgi:hypothetical protein
MGSLSISFGMTFEGVCSLRPHYKVAACLSSLMAPLMWPFLSPGRDCTLHVTYLVFTPMTVGVWGLERRGAQECTALWQQGPRTLPESGSLQKARRTPIGCL